MNDYQKLIKDILSEFTGENILPETKRRFMDKVHQTDKLTKETNIDEHICAFFVPYDRKTGSVYLGHHIKADSWIPPGGHVNRNEHPVDTVVREFKEELNYDINKGQIEKFCLSIMDIRDNPRNPCKVHYDFWYLVHVPKINFKYIKKEYYDAGWYGLDEAVRKMDVPEYLRIVRTIKETVKK